MRRIDKKKSIQRANLMVEQRYLESKGLISEAILPLKGGKFAFAEGEDNVPSNLADELEKAGIDPSEVGKVVLTNAQGKEIKTIQANGNLDESVKDIVVACAIGLAGLVTSCSKQEEPTFSMNSNVHGTEYTVDSKAGKDSVAVNTHGGGVRSYKVTKLKDQQGNASGGVLLKEKPTDEEIAIYSFGITLREEDRSNPNASHDGEKVVDYSIENPVLNVDYSGNNNPANSIRDLGAFKNAVNFIKDGGGKVFDEEMKKAQAKGIKGSNIAAADVISNY
jgi:hypothetical protein